MERLTHRELSDLGTVYFTKCASRDCKGHCIACDIPNEAEHKLKAYEDAEAQGLLKWDIHGKWFDVGSLSCRCSACGCKNDKETNYCPNCGAKMDLKESLEQALKGGVKNE